MKIQMRSVATGRLNEMEINTTPEKVKEWCHIPFSERPYIQDFFPELNADEREFILSGSTPEEWKELFGEEE